MNKICNNCDTRLRLKICVGRDGDFRYCFRKTGSLEGAVESIFPFNEIDELYNSDYVSRFHASNLTIESYYENTCLLTGLLPGGERFPLGFINTSL